MKGKDKYTQSSCGADYLEYVPHKTSHRQCVRFTQCVDLSACMLPPAPHLEKVVFNRACFLVCIFVVFERRQLCRPSGVARCRFSHTAGLGVETLCGMCCQHGCLIQALLIAYTTTGQRVHCRDVRPGGLLVTFSGTERKSDWQAGQDAVKRGEAHSP